MRGRCPEAWKGRVDPVTTLQWPQREGSGCQQRPGQCPEAWKGQGDRVPWVVTGLSDDRPASKWRPLLENMRLG